VEDMPFGDHELQQRLAATFPSAEFPTRVGLETFKAFLHFMDRQFGSTVRAGASRNASEPPAGV